MTNPDTHNCPICAEPFKPDDICASDITEGTCHAACLEGSPVVDLETGEETGGTVDTYPYSDVMEPPPPQTNVQGIWDEIGTALALLDDTDVSPKARALIRTALESATGCKAPEYLGGEPTPVDWSDMASASKDGTMLRLLVNPDHEEFTAFDDSLTPFETIGFNNLADTGEDRWEFAGWDWQQDCFITGRGEVIGWSEMSPKPDGSKAPFVEPVVCVGRASIEKLLRGENVDTGRTILIPASDLNPPPPQSKENTDLAAVAAAIGTDQVRSVLSASGLAFEPAQDTFLEKIAGLAIGAMAANSPAPQDHVASRLVIVESPFAGDVEANIAYARAALRDCLDRGEAPYASHLLYTQPGVLDDSNADQRRHGIEAGLAWGKMAAATVVYTDRGISSGMQQGIDRAVSEGRPVEYRTIVEVTE